MVVQATELTPPLLDVVERTTQPLVVGLTMDPDRLVEARKLRLPQAGGVDGYADFEKVREETLAARRVFAERGWPVIDVTRRSVEETASAILQLYAEWRKPPSDA